MQPFPGPGEVYQPPTPTILTYEELDARFGVIFCEYPELNGNTNARAVAACGTLVEQLTVLHEEDEEDYGELIPMSPETASALPFSVKKLFFLFTDPEYPEDTIPDYELHSLLNDLLEDTGHDINKLPVALDDFVYLASQVYLPRFDRHIAPWQTYPQSQRFLMVYGAMANDMSQRGGTIPRQYRRS